MIPAGPELPELPELPGDLQAARHRKTPRAGAAVEGPVRVPLATSRPRAIRDNGRLLCFVY